MNLESALKFLEITPEKFQKGLYDFIKSKDTEEEKLKTFDSIFGNDKKTYNSCCLDEYLIYLMNSKKKEQEAINAIFVPRKESFCLKELGFDWPCLGWFIWKDDLVHIGENSFLPPFNPKIDPKTKWFRAPTYDQAFEWFQQEYDLHSYIGGQKSIGFDYKITLQENISSQETYKSTLDAKLACLRHLIKLIKKEN